MIRYSQYFTDDKFASALISLINEIEPKDAIELGIGNGALSKAAILRWPSLKVDAIDIDNEVCNSDILKRVPSITVRQGDVLDQNICYYADKKYDLALCNPPFIKIPKLDYLPVFEEANLLDFNLLKRLSADVIFIAKEMCVLRDGGIMAVILPDGLLTRKDYYCFRNAIISNHKLLHVVQLPEQSFAKTEARTHIVLIQKNKKTDSEVPISLMDVNGGIIRTVYVSKSKLEKRMDFSFCDSNIESNTNSILTSSDMDIVVQRGSLTYKDLRTKAMLHLHSNSFTNGYVFTDTECLSSGGGIQAKSGDIVMCRVGKRSVGKVCFVEKGMYTISDCLFRISVPDNYRIKLFNLLKSVEHQSRLKILSHGVCSKVISKVDLEMYLVDLMSKMYYE